MSEPDPDREALSEWDRIEAEVKEAHEFDVDILSPAELLENGRRLRYQFLRNSYQHNKVVEIMKLDKELADKFKQELGERK